MGVALWYSSKSGFFDNVVVLGFQFRRPDVSKGMAMGSDWETWIGRACDFYLDGTGYEVRGRADRSRSLF